jgi:hypothetical protein
MTCFQNSYHDIQFFEKPPFSLNSSRNSHWLRMTFQENRKCDIAPCREAKVQNRLIYDLSFRTLLVVCKQSETYSRGFLGYICPLRKRAWIGEESDIYRTEPLCISVGATLAVVPNTNTVA